MTRENPLIVEVYKEYSPPVNVSNTIRILLESIPERYVAGLKEVVLTNASGLSRERKRAKTASRARTFQVRGLYHQIGNGQPAWIEIFVDNTLKRWPRSLIKIPFFQHMAFGEVLYHEVGHHIHYTVERKFGNQEIFAEKSTWELFSFYFRKRYWYLQPLIWPLRLISRGIRWLKGSRPNKKGAESKNQPV
jgi:hypothetical protein